ncbi:MAG: Ig-like domain-containing protein, partial [Bacteroidota bacterium]
ELQFEKLGTVAQSRPAIFDGLDVPIQTNVDLTTEISGLTQTFNLGNGIDQTVIPAASYFEFTSSNPSVATVDEEGVITALSTGEAIITATLGGVEAKGSATVNVGGVFALAPTPTQAPTDVISIFSDAYTNEPVDYYNGFWQPYQTTSGANDITIAGDNIIAYTSLNFVGIQFADGVPNIDAGAMTHFHVDIQPREAIQPGDFLSIEVVNSGPDGQLGTGDESSGSFIITDANLTNEQWYSLDIPITDLGGLSAQNNLAQIIFSTEATISSIYVDNIYFYKDGNGGTGSNEEPDMAAPAPGQNAADVISIFSDAYPNINSNLNPNWGQATQVSEVSIGGNNTLRYGNLNFQGLELESSTDVSGMEFLHIDYWSANSTSLNVFLISSGPTETNRALTVPTMGWQSVDIPLGDFSPVDLADVIQFKFDGGGDIFLDNIYFYKSPSTGGGDEPTAAAPAPTQDASNVISLFSNAYSNVNVDTWRTSWSMATFEDVQIAGDDMKKYTDLDFVGVETVGGNLIDASNMTHFRLDAWSPNFTVFKIKLVDFGADGNFGGGDDTEHELVFENPGQGQWVSYDIPLTDFAGLQNSDNMAQFIFAASPAGSGTVFIDNIYFYRQ